MTNDFITKGNIIKGVVNKIPGGDEYLTWMFSLLYLLPILGTPVALYFSTNLGFNAFAYGYSVFILEALASATLAWVIPSNWFCLEASSYGSTITPTVALRGGQSPTISSTSDLNIIHKLYFPLGIIMSVMFSVGAMTAYIWNSFSSVLGSLITLFIGIGFPFILYVLGMIGIWSYTGCESRIKIASGIISFVGLLLGYGAYLLNAYFFPTENASPESVSTPNIKKKTNKHNSKPVVSSSNSNSNSKKSTNTRSTFQKILIGLGITGLIIFVSIFIYSIVATKKKQLV